MADRWLLLLQYRMEEPEGSPEALTTRSEHRPAGQPRSWPPTSRGKVHHCTRLSCSLQGDFHDVREEAPGGGQPQGRRCSEWTIDRGGLHSRRSASSSSAWAPTAWAPRSMLAHLRAVHPRTWHTLPPVLLRPRQGQEWVLRHHEPAHDHGTWLATSREVWTTPTDGCHHFGSVSSSSTWMMLQIVRGMERVSTLEEDLPQWREPVQHLCSSGRGTPAADAHLHVKVFGFGQPVAWSWAHGRGQP